MYAAIQVAGSPGGLSYTTCRLLGHRALLKIVHTDTSTSHSRQERIQGPGGGRFSPQARRYSLHRLPSQDRQRRRPVTGTGSRKATASPDVGRQVCCNSGETTKKRLCSVGAALAAGNTSDIVKALVNRTKKKEKGRPCVAGQSIRYFSRFRWEFRPVRCSPSRGSSAPPQLGSRAYKRVRVGDHKLEE